MSISESLPFRSPISKLLRFFYRSRDQWKTKCKAAKRENKSLKYRLAKMTESRDRWKAEVRSLRKSIPGETSRHDSLRRRRLGKIHPAAPNHSPTSRRRPVHPMPDRLHERDRTRHPPNPPAGLRMSSEGSPRDLVETVPGNARRAASGDDERQVGCVMEVPHFSASSP
jgi:hypothetical protein